MKTIIIDLPPNLSPNGIGLALRAIAADILTGAVVPVPPFHYCVDTAVGTVTFWDVDNEERIAPAAFHPRTLIRVGPEQASEPAPFATLPDPWPGMIVDVDADDGNRYRAAIAFVRSIGERTWIGFAAMGAKDARWNEGHIHEVRTPDGTTVWERPAEKVTT